jgi:hypothetical protein
MPSKAHTAPTAPLVSHHKRIEKCTMKKFGINGQLRNNFFLIVIHLSSLVKATMNAPHICNCGMVLTKRRIYDCEWRNEKKDLIQIC